ncbi:MAG: CPBP family intramembrane metalloprotease [Chloroflexota bacterium]|nr:CPBP family intramembrane metalloprotease [Chloroflexota bacterium]
MGDFFVRLAALIAMLPFIYGACALVQFTVIRPRMRPVVIGFFATVAATIGLLGLLSFTAPAILNPRTGTLLLVLAIVTALPLWRPVRALLARVTPLDPDSAVDLSGLIALLWLLTLTGTTLTTVNLQEAATQVRITPADAIVNLLAYPLLAFSLVGIFLTRGWRESVKRLGLERLSPRQILLAVALVVPLLVLNFAFDVAARRLQPEVYADLQGVLRAMSSNVTNPLVAVLLGLSAGVGEEILFRGAIQPRLGIVLTTLAFSVGHLQYGFTYAVAFIIVVGIILGYERKYLNTTACIITHATFNTIGFLLPLLAGAGGGG